MAYDDENLDDELLGDELDESLDDDLFDDADDEYASPAHKRYAYDDDDYSYEDENDEDSYEME